MIDMSGLGRMLIFFGIIMIVIGVLFALSAKIPFIGRLPGDIYIKKNNFSFYFPLGTSLLLSLILSLILFIIGHRR